MSSYVQHLQEVERFDKLASKIIELFDKAGVIKDSAWSDGYVEANYGWEFDIFDNYDPNTSMVLLGAKKWVGDSLDGCYVSVPVDWLDNYDEEKIALELDRLASEKAERLLAKTAERKANLERSERAQMAVLKAKYESAVSDKEQ